ncbi:MAG: dihydrolipoyl dehydrogenase [Rickettsia sp.]|nr:dihydrolipoyl dehydrogenase [Rickettsia sp.]
METQYFDLAIIGGGSAGYIAAVKASKAGLKTCCIEKNDHLGGTCLNEGCIPSKSLLNFSKKYYEIKNSKFENIGIKAEKVTFNLSEMINQKNTIINDLEKGIRFLFKQNKIEVLKGEACILDQNTIKIENIKNTINVNAKNILLATGSKVKTIENIPIDGKSIISSSEALSMKKIPSDILVVGGGYIGLELGSVYARLGAKVTVVESNERIIQSLDSDIGNILHKSLSSQGINFIFNSQVQKIKTNGSNVETLILGLEGEEKTIKSEQLLVAIGRSSNLDFLKNSSIELEINKFGFISVNEDYQTNIKNIYAIGDVIGGLMLAHKAEHEALEVIDCIVGKKNSHKRDKKEKLIPTVIYTNPEVASVGYNEDELNRLAIPYKIGKSYFKANAKAHTMLSKDGMVKIFASKDSHKILGACIIGEESGTLISEIVAYMEFGASTEDIALTIHAHPSLNEAIKEAANNV